MENSDKKFIIDYLNDYSKKIGVPSEIINLPNGSLEWTGNFNAIINGNVTRMVMRPMAIEITPESAQSIGLFREDEKMLNTEFGEVFYTLYKSQILEGTFELFRFYNPEKRLDNHQYVFRHTVGNEKYESGVKIDFQAGQINK